VKALSLQGGHVQAKSKKGRNRVLKILTAARDLIVEEGFQSFSMRKVADRCGIKVGNLSYYYASKDALIHDLVDSVLHGYEEIWNPILEDESLCAEEKLSALIKVIMDDLGTKETTRFFPELWVMATHDDTVRKGQKEIYRKIRAIIADLVVKINPKLNLKSAEVIAVFISSSIEGHIIFTGYNKACNEFATQTTGLAIWSFISLVKNMNNEMVLGSKL